MTYRGVQANRQGVSMIRPPTGASREKRPATTEPDPESEEVYGPIDYGESRIYISDAYYDDVYQQSPPIQPQTSSDQLPPYPAPPRTSPSSPPHCRTLRKKLSILLSHCSQFGSHWNTGTSNDNPRGRVRDPAKHKLDPQDTPQEVESTTQILSYSIPSTYSRLLPLEVAQKRDDIVHRPEGYEMSESRTY